MQLPIFKAVEQTTDVKLGHFETHTYDVLKDGLKVGEFQRDYHSYGVETFAPFQREGKWYALYSPEYTSLRCLDLETFKDLGDPINIDICSVEIRIPRYRIIKFNGVSKETLYAFYGFDIEESDKDFSTFNDTDKRLLNDSGTAQLLEGIHFSKFALTQGCLWGDDSSWNLTIYDISMAQKGIITPVKYNSNESGKYTLHPTYFRVWNGNLKDIVEINDIEVDVNNINNEEPFVLQFASRSFIKINKDISTSPLSD